MGAEPGAADRCVLQRGRRDLLWGPGRGRQDGPRDRPRDRRPPSQLAAATHEQGSAGYRRADDRGDRRPRRMVRAARHLATRRLHCRDRRLPARGRQAALQRIAPRPHLCRAGHSSAHGRRGFQACGRGARRRRGRDPRGRTPRAASLSCYRSARRGSVGGRRDADTIRQPPAIHGRGVAFFGRPVRPSDLFATHTIPCC